MGGNGCHDENAGAMLGILIMNEESEEDRNDETEKDHNWLVYHDHAVSDHPDNQSTFC